MARCRTTVYVHVRTCTLMRAQTGRGRRHCSERVPYLPYGTSLLYLVLYCTVYQVSTVPVGTGTTALIWRHGEINYLSMYGTYGGGSKLANRNTHHINFPNLDEPTHSMQQLCPLALLSKRRSRINTTHVVVSSSRSSRSFVSHAH
jgi:hypothetical protein